MPTTRRYGPYEIVAPIGAGGMGEVFRARDTRLGRDVAVKVLRAGAVQDDDRRVRFEQEARAASALNHPNLLAVYDIGWEDGAAYIVSELLEGETLREKLQAGPIPLRRAIDYATQAARGLAAAHSRGIVHRDLKPENLFVTKDGRVKILDFGLAKQLIIPAAATSAPTMPIATAPGVVMGTVGYMSPEQVRGASIDHRSDIFSLGVVLYEMATGRRAFQGDSAVETMNAILRDEPPDVDEPLRSTSPGLARVIHHCLEKEPEHRFQSAGDLAFQLESLSTTSTTRTGALPQPAEQPRPAMRRIAGGAAALALLAVGLIAGRYLTRDPGPDLSKQRYAPLAIEMPAQMAPDWSPDGNNIVYTAAAAGVFQVFTRGIDQPLPAQLTRGERDCSFPFWSPDGTRIYFVAGTSESGDLWTIGAAGGKADKVLSDVLAASISPDGKKLAFVRANRRDLWVKEGASEPRVLRTLGTGLILQIRFSPDGSTIAALVELGKTRQELWTVASNGGAERAIAGLGSGAPPIGLLGFDWLPDGRHVVVGGRVASGSSDHLFIFDVNAGAMKQITSGIGFEASPAISRDGTRIAYVHHRSDQRIKSVAVDGSGATDVLARSLNEHCPSWSPSGELVYARGQNRADEIWTYDPRSKTDRRLLTLKGEGNVAASADRLSEPAVSPDGTRVAYTRAAGGDSAVYVASISGGPAVPLTSDHVRNLMPAWSPDGQTIIVSTLEKNGAGIYRASSSGAGPLVPVVAPRAGIPKRAKVSPDGAWVLVTAPEGLVVVSMDGKQTRPISREPGWEESYGWSRDGKTVYAIRRTPAHRWVAVAIDVATGEPKQIADIGDSAVSTVHGWSLAPDGKSFAMTLETRRTEIWSLTGFDGR